MSIEQNEQAAQVHERPDGASKSAWIDAVVSIIADRLSKGDNAPENT